MKKIAVVILNWNGTKLLEQFLPSVLRFSGDASIYVADNASTDDSVAFVKAHFPSVKIIRNTGNFGFAEGYNQALRFVEEDIYALVNSDIEVTQNWLSPILETFENSPETAIVQPKILDFKRKKYFEYAGAAGGFIDKYGFPFCRGRIFDTIEKDNGQYDDSCKIFWASGACFFIRKDIYRELGGFDAGFFAHQEEIDLCWRAFNKNYTVIYRPESVVYHVGGATLEHGNPRKTFLNFRNSLLMLTKNLPKSGFYQTIFLRMAFDGIAAVQFLFKGKPAHFWAVAKAHFSFYALFYTAYKKREASQLSHYYKVSSIVRKYFLQNGKVFGSLF